MKKKLIMDVDGVLRNITETMFEIYKTKYDKTSTLTDEDIKDYEMQPLFKKYELGNMECFFRQYAKDIFKYSNPYLENINQMFRLKEIYDIDIITNQFKGLECYTCDWLNIFGVPYDNLIFSANKSITNGDVLVDDNIDNLILFKIDGGESVCMDRTWNRDYSGRRIKSLRELR